jgi:hypothetical protein
VDVAGIVAKSLEAAGLALGAGGGAWGARPGGGEPLIVEVPESAAKSLEAPDVSQDARTKADADAGSQRRLAEAGWEGEGWELVRDEPGALRDGPLLFGYASSGMGCEVGNQVRSVSRRLSLGYQPELRYVRKLNLKAAVNDYTSASFSVLVDGVQVDKVSAVGMDHTEAEWQQRSGIDLTPFANRTVTLTFEVAANSNVCDEVFAKAWVDRITVRHTAPLGEM